MAEVPFKYDVALSFLAEDDPLAGEIADQLKARMKVFVYFDRQRDLVGKDGVEKFSTVFGKEARVCVVLYRDGWGRTAWTRVEETAIKSRAFEAGWEFLLVVALDRSRTPAWLPKTKLWLGFEHFGVLGTASIIDARVQEAGGDVREETVTETAERLGRQAKKRAEQERYLGSAEGVAAAAAEIQKLFSYLDRKASEISGVQDYLQMRVINPGGADMRVVTTNQRSFSIGWFCHYSNTLETSELQIGEFNGPYINPVYRRDPELSSRHRAWFQIDESDRPAWCVEGEPGRLLSTERIAEFFLKRLLESSLEKRGS